MEIRTYKQALDYLEGFIGKVIFQVNKDFLKEHDPLERIRVLLSLLGNPQEKFKSVLVGGTSGKGSTAYLISHILTTAGYKTGFTLSPHLQKVNERLQINGQQISDQKFTQMVSSIIQTIELMRKMKIGAPSYFEILVAMAFKYFEQQKVDIAVVEVGMGGEFDATNTLNPLIAVLTNVSLDHTNVLGKTIEKIAKTKVGIIKKFIQCHPEFISGSPARRQASSQSNKMLKHPPALAFGQSRWRAGVQHDTERPSVVTGVRQPSVIKIVEERCKEVRAKLYRLGKDFDESIIKNYKLSLLGDYQRENASLAVKTVRQLADFGFKVSESQIRQALRTAFFPGRFEVLRCHPELVSGSPAHRQASLQSNEMLKQVQHDMGVTLVLDGAHNPTKMRAFLTSLKKLYPKQRKIFIIGFKFDKDIEKMLRQIVRVADLPAGRQGEIIITQFKAKTDTNIHASADAFKVKSQISKVKSNIKVTVEKDSGRALKVGLKTIQQSSNRTIVVVTGSLYLVGEIRSLVE